MSPAVASIVCAAVVLALFWLDRADTVAASSALWIPVIWLTLACSRSPHQWLLGQSLMDQLGSGNVDLEGSPIDRFAYSALILLGTIVLIKRGGRVGKLLRANGLILLFLVYCLASLAWSDFADIAIKRWIKAAGDLIMVRSAGAYGAVMASSYNTRPLAPEVMVDGTRFAVVRPRPSIEEMLSSERFPPWMEPA